MPSRTVTRSESLDSCSSANTSISSDSEYTLSAYGDISYSEINFVPTCEDAPILTPCLNPNRHDPTYRRNAKRPQPPTNGRRGTMMRKPQVTDTDFNDFTTLVDSLRDSRDRAEALRLPIPSIQAQLAEKLAVGIPPTKIASEKKPPTVADSKSPSEMPRTMKKIPAPLQLKNTEIVQSKAQTPPNTPASPASPNAKKPWRGNSPLPQRPPLPRWDLLDPDVTLEGMRYKVKMRK